MKKKAPYHTKQMNALRTYLESMPGKHITVQEIAAYFNTQNISMGKTTIYRHLEKMVADGSVIKYVTSASNSAYFEYVDGPKHCHPPVCYHCKCQECGKLIHLECDELNQFKTHALREHGFDIDFKQTIFHGVCQSCKESLDEKGVKTQA